jgi:hypothetical protein
VPANLRLDRETGVIYGTPILAGTSSFMVMATDATDARAIAVLTITVKEGDRQPAWSPIPDRQKDGRGVAARR